MYPFKKIFLSFLFILISFLGCNSTQKSTQEIPSQEKYALHENISATYFWVGEGASDENGYIDNFASAWDEQWMQHYGGIDNPYNRNGYLPADFTPLENPFYIALPYNDLDEDGNQKKEVKDILPWYDANLSKNISQCKNRWVKITLLSNNKTVYAQWEDVGPFQTDDKNYVFGSSNPINTINNNAGIDVSPAVRTYLNMQDIDSVSWRFVDTEDVPDGPWKQIITIRK
ncbi:MAG: hypothetical protein GXO11_01820 [Epsilonproteobacteria bacterium]|nr:hypothetical protein [Campylobacterota bacterium]